MNVAEHSDTAVTRVKLYDVVFIVCICAIVYTNSFDVGWMSDDFRFITSNPAIKTLSNAGEFFTNPHRTTASTSGYEGIFRPLRTLSFSIDYAIWGLRPFGFHLTNLLFHAAASALLFLVFLQLIGNRSAALIGALLFAVHPAHVEAVTWISSRADGMVAVFLLCSFLLFVSARKNERQRTLLWVGALVIFLPALLSKESAIILPALLIAYDVSFPERPPVHWRTRLLQHGAFIVVAVAYFLIRSHVLQAVSQRGYWGGSFWVTALTMGKCFLIYLQLIFFPPTTNCVEYMVPLAAPGFSLVSWLPAAVTAIVIGAMLSTWRLSRIIGFGFIWFLISLAPVSNLFPISMLMAERFLYLPMMGVCLGTATLIDTTGRSKGKFRLGLLNAIACVILLSLAIITVLKNSAWRDPVVLWTQNLDRYPHSYRARMGLADTYLRSGQNVEAIKHYEQAIRDFPNAEVFHDLGNAYQGIGDYGSAIAAYKTSLSLSPNSSWTHTSLGITYLTTGRNEKAIEHFRQALSFEPNYPMAHYCLGIALEESGDIQGALREYTITLALDPDREDARRRLHELQADVEPD